MKPTRFSVCTNVSRSILCALSIAAFSLEADEPKPDAAPPEMRELSPGVFELGKMRLDKNASSLAVPGKVNMVKGALEYLICTPQGSTHESLLVSEVQPSDIHFGMLLLGAKGAGILTPAPSDAPPPQINAEYLKRAPRLQGDRVTLTAKWKDAEGKERSAPVEDWVLNTETHKAAVRGPWIYTGSMFAENTFLAQAEGSIATVVTNPAALINNPRKGSDNDQIWVVNEKNVPPLDTPIEIVIKIEPAEPKPQ
jgi:hypothetical protein